MDKRYPSPEAAVADIPSGATIAAAGFGTGHRFPTSLLTALLATGVKDLCIVGNALGRSRPLVQLVEEHKVSRLIVSFSARPGMRSPAEDQIAAGDINLELVPQGTLVERLRAGGAGVAAIYVPTGFGTPIAEGKDVRYFDGEPYLLERAIRVDYALVRAHRADPLGNLEFRGGSQNFNPSFAKAARVAIAEVDEIVDVGEIPPDRVGLPGIFVSRVVKSTISVDPADHRNLKRPAESAKTYLGKPALTRAQIAQRAARLLPDSSYINLGSGIPTMVSNYLEDRDIVLHAENGILGYGGALPEKDIDPDAYNASGEFCSILPGASFFDSVTSFEMVRGSKLSAVVLGAYQVDQSGSVANWSTPDMVGGAIGGAMDLVANDSTVIILMEHRDSHDRPKLVRECTYPLTGINCVDVVVTDLALLRRSDGIWILEEIAPGFTTQEVIGLMDIEVSVSPDVRTMPTS